MKRKRMSQEDLAEMLSKGRSAVGSYIRGETEPNIEALIKITDFFDITLDELIFADISSKNYKIEEKKLHVAEKNEQYNEKIDLLRDIFKTDNTELSKKVDDLATIMAKFHFDLKDIKKEIKKSKA